MLRESARGRPTNGSRSGVKVLAHNPGMASGDAKEGKRRSFWAAPVLFPIAKRMHTDGKSLGKLGLREADKSTQCGYIAGRELTAHDALALAPLECALEVSGSQFWGVFHRRSLRY
jgi:hypothetical protein